MVLCILRVQRLYCLMLVVGVHVRPSVLLPCEVALLPALQQVIVNSKTVAHLQLLLQEVRRPTHLARESRLLLVVDCAPCEQLGAEGGLPTKSFVNDLLYFSHSIVSISSVWCWAILRRVAVTVRLWRLLLQGLAEDLGARFGLLLERDRVDGPL